MENSGLKHGFEYTASSNPVARGPGAWSREIVYCIVLKKKPYAHKPAGCAGEVVRKVMRGVVRKVVRWACALLCAQRRMAVQGVVRKGYAQGLCARHLALPFCTSQNAYAPYAA